MTSRRVRTDWTFFPHYHILEESMEFDSGKQGNAVVIKVKGRMDAVSAPGFEKECGDLVDAGEKILIVDLGGLEYISSAGLRSILAAAKKVKAAQGGISFCNLLGMVQEVFSISGFATMFPIHGSLEEAISKGESS
jgi:anti-anti-sigma factor